jgi:hypothetical protein
MNVEEWCERLEPLPNPSGDQLDQIHALMLLPGFTALLGVLLAERQGALMKLANTQLVSEQGKYSASVTQGYISGLDYPRNLLIELFRPKRDPSSEGTNP